MKSNEGKKLCKKDTRKKKTKKKAANWSKKNKLHKRQFHIHKEFNELIQHVFIQVFFFFNFCYLFLSFHLFLRTSRTISE